MSRSPAAGGLNVRRVLDGLLYGLVLTGLVPVLSSGELAVWAWLLVTPAVVASAFFRAPLARREVRRVVNVLAVLVLAGLAWDAVQTRDWLLDSVWFVLFVTVVKLFQRDTLWDHYQIVALSFLQVLGAAILNPSLQFAFGFLLFVVLLAFTLLFLHVRRAEPDRERIEKGVLPWRFFVVTGALAVVLFLSSFLLFFLFPRLGLGFFVAQVRRPQEVAGFADRVELGGFGTIRDNETVVLRVKPVPLVQPDGPLRLRGMAFDRYDGRAWQRSTFRRFRLDPDIDGVFHLADADRLAACPATRAALYLEPLEMPARLLFGPPGLTEVHPPSSRLDFLRRARAVLFQDSAGDVFYEAKDVVGLQYETVARDCGPGAALPLPSPRQAARAHEGFVDLPPHLDPRIPALAHQLTDAQPEPRARAMAIENWLRGSFRYSLDEAHPPGNALAHFLFDDRSGHCEYFATAMAVLLRAVGVPSRVVNGFYGGRWNEIGQYVQIRQGDAHSWVEAWFDDEGWTTWDPTPPVEMRLDASSGAWAAAREWIDYLRYRWYQWVVEYSLEKQVEVFKKAAEVFDLEPNLRGLRKAGDLVKRGLVGLLVLGVGAALARWLWLRWKRRQQGPRDPGRRAALGLFAEWVRAGRRVGVAWQPTEPPSTFAGRLVDRLPHRREDLDWLLGRFHDVLYGGVPLTDALTREMRTRIRTLHRGLPRSRRGVTRAQDLDR